MDDQTRIDELQEEIIKQKKVLDKKQKKAKALRAEHTVLEEQLNYLRQQVNLKEGEIKMREEKLNELRDGAEAKASQKRNFIEKDRRRNDFDKNVSDLLEGFKKTNPGFAKCKVGYPTSIKVKYLKGTKDGEMESLDNATLLEAKFRINPKTTLTDLKDVACKFWGIELADTMALREVNLATLDLYMNMTIQDMLYQELLSDELYLFEINRQATISFAQQEDCFAENAPDRRARPKKIKRATIAKADLPHENEELKEMYKSFEETYQGLRSFREPDKEDIQEFKDNRTKRRDASLLVAVVILVMLACSLGCVLTRRQVTRDFWIQAGVHSQLLQNFQGDENFFDINTIDNLNTFITSVFAPLFFVTDTLSLVEPFSSRYIIVGPIRFRQQRVQYTDCSQSGYDISGKCIETIYNSDTEETSMIEGGGWEYTDASDNDIKTTVSARQITGQLGEYDGGGYVVDFSKTLTVTNFTALYNAMVDSNWYEIRTQDLFINVIMYAPAYDIWINVTVVRDSQFFEFTLTNYVIATRLTAEVFSPNLFGKRTDRLAAQILDIIRLVVSLCLVWEYVMTIKEMRKGKRNWSHAYSTLGLMDCLTFILILASFSMSYELSEDDEALYNNDEFFDAEFYSYNFKICMILNAAVILLLMLRLVFCFRLSRSVHIHLYTIEKASKNVLAFLLILLPIIIGFVILMMNIYGTSIKNFRNFEQTLLRILLLISGYGEVLTMLLQFRVWTVFLWLIYFFGVLFFLISAFMGIYMDAYRQVKMLCGKDDVNCGKATKDMYKTWFKESLPGFIRRRCYKEQANEEE
jgi:hypothetical protein